MYLENDSRNIWRTLIYNIATEYNPLFTHIDIIWQVASFDRDTRHIVLYGQSQLSSTSCIEFNKRKYWSN